MPLATDLLAVVRKGTLAEIEAKLAEVARERPGEITVATSEQQTLLFFAVCRTSNALEVSELLICSYGVNALHEDMHGQTALHYCAKTGHVDCLQLLVSRKCDIDHCDSLLHQTPLFYAARYGTNSMVRSIVSLRATVDFRDRNGLTPLFWAGSLPTCEELVRFCGASYNVVGHTGISAADQHRFKNREDIAVYLETCAEARSQRGRIAWGVLRLSTLPSADAADTSEEAPACIAYVTAMTRQRDVEHLCELENEFIEEHRVMLQNVTEGKELFSNIGLNPDATVRRQTVQSIATLTKQSGRVRHYTLKCTFLPPKAKEEAAKQSSTARVRAYQTVGYIYFRIYDGHHDDSGDIQSPARKPHELEGSSWSYIVVSHLKVGSAHKRRGVATLLLASMLQVAEAEQRGDAAYSCLQLSVIEKNIAAAALYRRLGFVNVGLPYGETVLWQQMRMYPTAARVDNGGASSDTLGSIRKAWLQHVPGACGFGEEVEPVPTKKRPLTTVATAEWSLPLSSRLRPRLRPRISV